jgi:predicted RNA-binding protein with EMAP domain
MVRLFDKFKGWRKKRAWLHHLADVETNLSLEYARFTIKDLRRREEMRKLWKKIHKRDSQKDYVV